jgi:hypothetical protein
MALYDLGRQGIGGSAKCINSQWVDGPAHLGGQRNAGRALTQRVEYLVSISGTSGNALVLR